MFLESAKLCDVTAAEAAVPFVLSGPLSVSAFAVGMKPAMALRINSVTLARRVIGIARESCLVKPQQVVDGAES